MLFDDDALRQPVTVVVFVHLHGPLNNDWTVVEFVVDQMHGAARHLDPVVRGLLLGVQARKRRQEGRVNVEDAIGKIIDKEVRQESHVAGETDPLGTRLDQLFNDRSIMRFAVGVVLVGNYLRFDAVLSRPLDTGRISTIRDDHRHRGRHRSGFAGADDGPHVGAAAGDENSELCERHEVIVVDSFDPDPDVALGSR